MKKVVIILGVAALVGTLLLFISFAGNEKRRARTTQSKKSIFQNDKAQTSEKSGKSMGNSSGIIKVKSYWLEKQRPERLQVSDLDMPLVFTGSKISNELKQVILADLDLIYGDWCSYEKYNWSGRASKAYDVDGKQWKSEDNIDFSGAYAPTLLHENFGWFGEYENQETVFVPEVVIEAYKKAWQLRDENQMIFQELENFIEEVNLASAENPVERLPRELMWTPQQNAPQPSEIKAIVKSFSAVELRGPSLLDVSKNVNREAEGEPSFVAKAYILKNGTNIPQTKVVLVYDEDSWKFVYGALGT